MVTMNTIKLEDTPPPVPNDGVYYPESDGEPVAESDFQYVPLTYATSALSVHFSEEPDIYVTGDMLIYFVQGDPTKSVAPDVFLIPNLDKRFRTSYFMWLEGQVPTFIMEITSNSTWRDDIGRKRDLYESWGVSEYWMYDPTEETRLTPLLQGFRLVDGVYEPIEVGFDGESYRGYSSTLGLELHARKDWFRFFNPLNGEYLNNLEEAEAARLSAERELDKERARNEVERARREELERLLREHDIEPPD